jgi:uncharacterized RDD family membrane protein YckC
MRSGKSLGREDMNKASFAARAGAFFIDHMIITCLTFVLVLVGITKVSITSAILKGLSLAFALYLLKDCFRGRSLGKWFMGIVVLENDQIHKRPSVFKLVVRNLFTYIWPMELILLLGSEEKTKLGDRIAKTEVFKSGKSPGVAKVIGIVLLILILFGTVLFIGVNLIIKRSDAYTMSVEYMNKNNQVQSEVGGIIGYGFFVSGSVNVTNGYGTSNLYIPVKGNTRNLNVHIFLTKEPQNPWVIRKVDY